MHADVRRGTLILLLALTHGLSLGCVGDVVSGAARPGDPSAPRAPSDPDEPPPLEDPFALDRESPRLLPLETRLARVAAVAGVEPADPLLDDVRAARIALGDYDHSRNILPDERWSASRMSTWIRVMRPICRSDAMRTRYPGLAEDPGALVAAAWGRDATAEDRAARGAELGAVPADARDETVCLAVLSSAELVLR